MSISEWIITLVSTGIIPFTYIIALGIYEFINNKPTETKKKGRSKR